MRFVVLVPPLVLLSLLTTSGFTSGGHALVNAAPNAVDSRNAMPHAPQNIRVRHYAEANRAKYMQSEKQKSYYKPRSLLFGVISGKGCR